MISTGIRLTPLGSAGWMPTPLRHTCAYALEYRKRLILFDAGTGLARLQESWAVSRYGHYERIIIFLSHYHLDHIAGLIYLPRFFAGKQVQILAPGERIYGRGNSASHLLNRIVTPPFFGRSIADFPLSLTIRDLDEDTRVLDGIRIRTRIQDHSDPSIGIRLDDSVAYLTDTGIQADTAEFLSGCRLMMHEAWFDEQEINALRGASGSLSEDMLRHLAAHSQAAPVAEAARQAGVETLLLIHLNPRYEEERLLRMAQRSRNIFSGTILAQDGDSVTMSR